MPTRKLHPRAAALRALLGATAMAALAIASAGCTTTGTSDVDPADYDYRLRHPIMISEEPEVFDMRVGMNGPAISPEIESAIRDYVGEYRADGTGNIAIQVPTGSANAIAAAETGHAVHYALVRAGVPRGNIQIMPYEVGDHAEVAPLRLTYLRVKAVAPHCGIWPASAQGDYRNADYHNLGCAQQQNLAAMVANPADFLRPRPLGPADGYRRADIISKYRRGEDPQTNIMLIESDLGT
jgi:pilus assembly protein CpaD